MAAHKLAIEYKHDPRLDLIPFYNQYIPVNSCILSYYFKIINKFITILMSQQRARTLHEHLSLPTCPPLSPSLPPSLPPSLL